MTATLCPAHATAAYSQAFDEAWLAIEDAIAKVGLLNDTLFEGEVLVNRAPLADVALMREKARQLKTELDCYESAREPLNLRPVLPGEIRY
jgi:hypothetical protein